MGNSLREQLLKAGLVDPRQARKAEAGKVRDKKGRNARQASPPSASAQAAQRTAAEKAARDRALNLQRQAKAERKAAAAQIQQIIEQNRLPRDDGEIGYHFIDGSKVRKVYVTEGLHEQLTSGRLSIVKLNGRYDVVPVDAAEKIRARDARCVVERPAIADTGSDDDAYKDHPVPDDLMW